MINNQLHTLPSEITMLEKLCVLDLTNNQIQYLPTGLGQLRRLAGESSCVGFGLFIDGNPLISPPPEVINQGTPAILGYLRNEAWWYLQRLIAGGAGAVGLVAAAILSLRWYNRRRYGKKKKNDAA